MELDELKQKWMELSEQVEKNELLNRQIIIDMIQSKKETYLQQQLRVEKIGFGVLGIFLGVVCYTFWRNVAPDWISWYLLGMVIWLLVMQSLMFRIVYTLKTVRATIQEVTILQGVDESDIYFCVCGNHSRHNCLFLYMA